MDNIFKLIDNLPKINKNIFTVKSIPIIFNEKFNAYIINFNDVKFLSEYNGLDYNKNIYNILNENNILSKKYLIAISENFILNNPEIIYEIPNFIVIREQLIYDYIEYIVEQSDYVKDQYSFIYEGIVNDAYIKQYVLLQEGIIDNVKDKLDQARTHVSDTIQKEFIDPYKKGRDNSAREANRSIPNIRDKAVGVGNVVDRNVNNFFKAMDRLDDYNDSTSGMPDIPDESLPDPVKALRYAIKGSRILYKNKTYIKGKGLEKIRDAQHQSDLLKHKIQNTSDIIKSNIQSKINAINTQISNLQQQLSKAGENIQLKQNLQNKITALKDSIQALRRQ